MKAMIKALFLGTCALSTTGCFADKSDSFIFTADLPPSFAYYAVAKYAPAKGETCTVTLDDNPYLGFNREWRTAYKPESEIPIYRTVKGCRLAIYKIDLEINAIYGADYGDFSGDTTAVIIREELKTQYTGTFVLDHNTPDYPITKSEIEEIIIPTIIKKLSHDVSTSNGAKK